MAVNGLISTTSFTLKQPKQDIDAIKAAITRLEGFSVNVENCGYGLKCQSCQGCQYCQACQSCQNCNCASDSDGGG